MECMQPDGSKIAVVDKVRAAGAAPLSAAAGTGPRLSVARGQRRPPPGSPPTRPPARPPFPQVLPKRGLSAGAIAGVVIGVLLGVALLAALAYFVVYKRLLPGYMQRQGSGFRDLEAELTTGNGVNGHTLGDTAANTNTGLVRSPSPAALAELTRGSPERQL